MRWAIVIGVDEYGADEWRLTGAVSDALRFRDWVVAPEGGGVPASNLRLLVSEGEPAPTKDNIVTAINDVVLAAGEEADLLYFYFSGHGITARVANRDESALVTPGFDDLHTDHSLAIRSLTEHLETTPFRDQFFFIDACRNIPWEKREFEIGRWPVPRRRDPGASPVQQFILYATSPGRTAREVGWPGEAQGAFTGELMKGLAGEEQAKAWSWERNCYEVRWERLADFVHRRMSEWPEQVPQDAGSRGVAGRDRDALIASFPRGHFPNLELTVNLAADSEFADAEVSVLDAIGEPVVSALKVPGTSQTFRLPPKIYAVRAATTSPGELVGSLVAPVELYADRAVEVGLRPPEALDAAAGREEPPGTIEIRSSDPLAVAELRDEAGAVVGVARAGETRELKPGFYRVRQVGPEGTETGQFVVLSAGKREPVTLAPPEPTEAVARLTKALGVEAVAWALPSTIVAASVGAALQGEDVPGLGVDLRRPGVALFAVAGDADPEAVRDIRVRLWPMGCQVPPRSAALEPTEAGVAAAVEHVAQATPCWAALERNGATTVVALQVLPDRLATLVAQLDSDRIRLYQFHPAAGPDPSSTPDRLRRVEYLQRLILGGRLDGAGPLAEELAAAAAGDPFAGLVAGYALLRLGRHQDLGPLASAVAGVAPQLSDAPILRGEYEAAGGRQDAADQAFAEAVNAGVPLFGEGLTRLVEGLRKSSFVHPRGALVRHIFQRHARGTMWAAFTPVRALAADGLVISGADLGFEG